jgi:hypothetical protein
MHNPHTERDRTCDRGSTYGAKRGKPVATAGKCARPENGSNKPIRRPSATHGNGPRPHGKEGGRRFESVLLMRVFRRQIRKRCSAGGYQTGTSACNARSRQGVFAGCGAGRRSIGITGVDVESRLRPRVARRSSPAPVRQQASRRLSAIPHPAQTATPPGSASPRTAPIPRANHDFDCLNGPVS